MLLALKKKPRFGIAGYISHSIGQRLDHSIYSHVEILFSDGISASSVISEGVRFKKIGYTFEAWDFLTLPDELEPQVRNWYVEHEGEGYDYLNMLRFAISVLSESPDKWACTETAATAFGWRGAWRLGPGGLADRCQDEFGSVFCCISENKLT